MRRIISVLLLVYLFNNQAFSQFEVLNKYAADTTQPLKMQVKTDNLFSEFVTVSSDGNFIASCDKYSNMLILNRKKQLISRFKVNDNVRDIEFSPDGKAVLVAYCNGLSTYSLQGKETYIMMVYDPIQAHFNQYGNKIAIVCEKSVQVLDLRTRKPIVSLGNDFDFSNLSSSVKIQQIAAFDSGDSLVCYFDSRSLLLCNLLTQNVKSLRINSKIFKNTLFINFTADNKAIYAQLDTNKYQIWNIALGELNTQMEHDYLSPLPKNAVVREYFNSGLPSILEKPKSIFVFNEKRDSVEFAIDNASQQSDIECYESKFIAQSRAFEGNEFTLWNVDGILINNIKKHSKLPEINSKIIFDSEGDKCLKLNKLNGEILLYDNNKQLLLNTINCKNPITAQFSNSNKSFFIVSDSLISEYSIKCKLLNYNKINKPINYPVISKNCQYLLFNSNDSLYIYDIKTKKINSLPVNSNKYAFNNQAKKIVVLDDKFLSFYDSKGKLITRGLFPQKNLKYFDYSPDNKCIATYNLLSKKILIWNCENNEMVKQIQCDIIGINNLKFANDCEHLLVANNNGTIAYIDISSNKAVNFYTNQKGEWINFTNDGYYCGSINCEDLVEISNGNTHFNLRQLKYHFCRPDKIAEILSPNDKNKIRDLKNVYNKEIQLLGLNENTEFSPISLPKIEIGKQIKNDNLFIINFEINENVYNMLNYSILINNKSLIDKKPLKGAYFELSEELNLEEGTNLIEIQAVNDRGYSMIKQIIVENQKSK